MCINNPGHMTQMAAMPIYGKNLSNSYSSEPVNQPNIKNILHVAMN